METKQFSHSFMLVTTWWATKVYWDEAIANRWLNYNETIQMMLMGGEL